MKLTQKTFNDLSKNSLFENYDAITIDYFHRGLSLEALDKDREDLLDIYLQEKNVTFELIDETKTKPFISLKLIKNKNHISPALAYETLYNHLI